MYFQTMKRKRKSFGNKGESIFSFVFTILIGFMILALFGAGFLTTWTNQAIGTGNFTGIEAFFIDNLLAIIIVVMLLSIVVVFWGGSGR